MIVRGDALHLPLRDESVDLIVTSPPYFALRSYRDGGEHYDGQIGSEPTPQAFLEALWAVTAECWRVLKPSGSMFVNLGDKRAGSGGHNNSGISGGPSQLQGRSQRVASDVPATRRNAPDRYNQAAFGRVKSRMLLPHRYAIGCEDGHADPEGKGWIVRSDLVWSKPNGLPESVRDRCRDSHEYVFHLTKSERYYSAIDEIRVPHLSEANHYAKLSTKRQGETDGTRGTLGFQMDNPNPLGALPGSVWQIPSEPLKVPDWLGVDHFAAFPSELPRRIILGWSPPGICVECGEGRRPAVEKELVDVWHRTNPADSKYVGNEAAHLNNRKRADDVMMQTSGSTRATITGYECGCPAPTAPTRPAVVLDPFSGTGTTAAVARALGRTGIGVDLSADYCKLGRWRVFQSGTAAKAEARSAAERQGMLL